MDSRSEFVRLLEEMDKVLGHKKKELAELDDRLEVARDQVSQKEASEIQRTESDDPMGDSNAKDPYQDENVRNYIAEQKRLYERQLAEFAEKLSELEQMNQELRDQNYSLNAREWRKENQEQQFESSYYILSEKFQQLYKENAELRSKLAETEAIANEQRKQLEKTNQLDSVLEDVYLNKLESLKKTIELKDEEIKRLRIDNQLALESLGLNSGIDIDPLDRCQPIESDPLSLDEKHRLIKIADMLRDKDSQIDLLKSQLSEATQELEKSASLIESLTNQQDELMAAPGVDDENDICGSVSEYRSAVNGDELDGQQISSQQFDSQQVEALMADSLSEEDIEDRAEENQVGSAAMAPQPPSEKDSSSLALEKFRIDETLKLQRHFSQLEEENLLLELAMKEILQSLKWADSQCSTLLIDCPSIDRLCQVIEARIIVSSRHQSSGNNPRSEQDEVPVPAEQQRSDMFQLVLLKSELDIMRGQNEQLRADIKTLRREYQELLQNNDDAAALHSANLLSLKFAGSSACGTDEDPSCQRAIQSEQEPRDDENPNELKACEAQCQTELTLDSVSNLVERVQSATKRPDIQQCDNCIKASYRMSYLVQNIASLEARVTINDNNYITRFENWNRLICLISRDLADNEKSLKELRKENHLLRQQKYKTESKLELIEQQVVRHLMVCPEAKSILIESSRNAFRSDDQSKSIQSLTMQSCKSHHLEPIANARLSITLLKSIIGCLQARIAHKDKKIDELATLLTDIKFMASPA